MIILVIRTDKPEAELGLYNDRQQLEYLSWQAHRQLAETINGNIKSVLDEQDLELYNVQAIVFYKGPGSFTGLRIGAAVVNAWSNAQSIPIVSQNGLNWINEGIERLLRGDNETALPEYGEPAKTTKPKK